jgi:peroxiredoxin family protein
MSNQASPKVTKAILSVVENQIRDGNPPETKTTLERLQSQGIPRPEAVRLIACAVSTEIFEVLKHKEPFNEKRFVSNLNKLPTLPWE